MDQDQVEICTICDGRLDSETGVIVVKKKGIQTFIEKSKLKGDDKWKLWENHDHVTFHDKCRKRYAASSDQTIRKKKLSNESSFRENRVLSQPSTSTMQPHASKLLKFDFNDLCIICTKPLDRKNKTVQSLSKNNDHLIECAISRNDEYGEEILYRLDSLSALQNVPAYYHLHCMNSVKTTKNMTRNITKEETEKKFAEVTNYIENEGKMLYHLTELREVMGENFLNNNTLIKKLKEKYNDDILIEQHRGKQPVFLYKSFSIMELSKDWLSNPDSLNKDQKNIILRVAGEIVVADIKKQNYECENYPPSSKFLDTTVSEIPESLKTLLFHLLDSKCDGRKDVKRDTIAHSIISIVRPKSYISKFQLAVGTYVYRKTGSRLIIDLMSKLGVSATYHNIQIYEASVIMQPAKLITHANSFTQFVFDNTDHNVSTLDGHETFHCLGGIKVSTPDYNIEYEGCSKKLTKMPSASVLASQKQIKIIPFNSTNPDGLKNVVFVDVDKLHIKAHPDMPKSYVAYLCAKAHEIENIPTWKGFHEILSRDVTYSMSHVHCLPFINAAPSSLTTLHTALLYAVEETKKNNATTTFVTFDQPLYFKANSIICQSDNPDFKNVVVRLGGFHLLMSYMGAIGFIMDGSGLKDLWATAYMLHNQRRKCLKDMLSAEPYVLIY
ncbi:uncharacterized protein LOC123317849 [Coccinella septempunctata]|uniref:uncharacterized protein LOC123317849 n=1 Tax=Coccinella septempunctata TaxID=41139 RepID=UPI001D06990F|nr:uncharacterized protein LOC123317849 [Coccinella septempunctata]